MDRGRRVLVTGASGFVGAPLVRRLVDDPAVEAVVALDVRSPAAPVDGVVSEVGDIRSPDLAQRLAGHRIDVVVHLAWIVSPPPSMTEAEQRSVNVDGTANLLAASVEAGVRRFVVTSSGAAYGYHADNRPLLSEQDPLRGNAEFPYADHKRRVEEILADHRASHPELAQLVFRPGTILGPAADNLITNLFEKRLVVGVRGADSPFCFIGADDVVECLARGVTGSATGVYNLTGAGAMTLGQIAKALGKPLVRLPAPVLAGALRLLGALRLTRYTPDQVRFLAHRPVLDNARLVGGFGYRPPTSHQAFERFLAGRASAPPLRGPRVVPPSPHPPALNVGDGGESLATACHPAAGGARHGR